MSQKPAEPVFSRCQGSGQTVPVDKWGYARCLICGWADPNPGDVVEHFRGARSGVVGSHEEDTPTTRDPGRNRVAWRGPESR